QQVRPPREVNRLNHPLSRTVQEDIPWYMSGTLSLEQSHLTIRTPYMDNGLVRLLFQAPRTPSSTTDLQARYINDYAPALSRFTTDMGKLGTSGAVTRWLLPRVQGILFRTEYVYLTATPHWFTCVDRSLGFLHPERLLTGRHKYEWY